jgi:hypothetical protein
MEWEGICGVFSRGCCSCEDVSGESVNARWAKLEEGLTLNDETEEVASGMHEARTKLSVLTR